jgi:hypothetical protein
MVINTIYKNQLGSDITLQRRAPTEKENLNTNPKEAL